MYGTSSDVKNSHRKMEGYVMTRVTNVKIFLCKILEIRHESLDEILSRSRPLWDLVNVLGYGSLPVLPSSTVTQ